MGEYRTDWVYYLSGGTGSVRQMTGVQAHITATRRFTPWGEILEQRGQSVLGTGRLLTRNANPTQTNPYVPWKSDPAGVMLAPLALLAMAYGRKKNCVKWDNLLIFVVLTVGMGLSAWVVQRHFHPLHCHQRLQLVFHSLRTQPL